VYCGPVYHALAQAGIEVCVCNAAHAQRPGRKRDLADCQWIAELHEYGLLRPSFILGRAGGGAAAADPVPQEAHSGSVPARGQRLAKVLEDAGKIDFGGQ
jgi:hypothetical protein